ncbi:DENN domain-containing protein 1C isoform X1 [Hemicordylus capensis]|uniref:DENN domain-containing protein 1C isoform X1 n=1 Tax=Hemicordylus capensis TaxID=884348 RepID=UPI002302074B|nr:DENN domain-containing protein 1C isoform X1 [Hemicordylus capensis]
MGSRIKENPQKIFDLFFEAACPTHAEDDPQVLRQFPVAFNDQESIQTLPKFCFPFDVERVKENVNVQHFTFALTDLEGKQRFGFCRMAMGFRTCLCILSYLPWFEVFYKILNIIADHLAKQQFTGLDEFLSTLYRHTVPNLSSAINFELDPKEMKLKISTRKDLNSQPQDRSQEDPNHGTASAIYFIAPDHGKLPTIPESRNLTEFVVAVDVHNMLRLYASLLHERRILLTTSKLSTLTACVQASSSMLYPMHWQHIYIPVLPSHLLDYCCAPMPYLIGVHSSLMERVRSKALEDVVILNIDNNTLESPFQDLENLPPDVVSLLKYQLKKQSATTGDGVAQAFLRAQALLFGNYRKALICSPGEPISFCQDTFLQQGSSAMQAFLQRAVHLQLFKQFIEDRLEKLNSGDDFSSLFEQEINRSLSPGNMHSYQLWVENLKKGGGALISTMKTKTNPAVKNAYQYAKGHAKMKLKNMRSRLLEKDSSVDQDRVQGRSLNCDDISNPILLTRSSQSESLQSRLPITQHFGQSRPRRPQRQNSRPELQTQSTVSLDCPLEHDLFSGGSENLHPDFLDTGGIDLLGEIFETLSMLEPSQVGRPIYGTRSLDFCNLEERSFFTKLRPSRETPHESLYEEQDDGDSSYEDPIPILLPSLEQEDTQSVLLPSSRLADQSSERWDHGISEAQEIPGPEKATVLLQEEMVVSGSSEPSQVAWTWNADHEVPHPGMQTMKFPMQTQEVPHPSENETERCPGTESGEESKVGQTLDLSQVIATPTAVSPTPNCTSIQSSAALFQEKGHMNTESTAKESILALEQVTSPQHPSISRPLTQRRVSELKKKFEA